ncbi:MAG: TetR family transcriptional regulator [Gemmatimonadaceae bacterium]
MTKPTGPSERERLRAETARRLVESAFALLRDTPEAPFSHEAVAAHAGMAARTAYRHFHTQDDLVAAVWRHLRDTTGTRWPTCEAEILPLLRALYAQFERNATLTRAFLAARPRADYAVPGSAEGRAAFRQALDARLALLSRPVADELVGACVAIYSAPFWQMLRDRGQLAPRAAAAAACRTMQALIAASDAPAPTPSPPSPRSDHANPRRRPRRS